MPVRLNSPGGGSVTLDVPATGTTTTLNLPITGGTLVTTAGIPAQGQLQEQLFTSSGSWTAPAGVTRVYAVVVGGGGGGGSGNQTCTLGNGGGPGGSAVGAYSVTPGTSYTVTIGSGGTGGSLGFNNATAGGTSSFGAFLSATGGLPGGRNGGGGYAPPGIGSGGTLRNYSLCPAPFDGAPGRAGGQAAAAWSVSSASKAGGGGDPSIGLGVGGHGGIVYLQWVG